MVFFKAKWTEFEMIFSNWLHGVCHWLCLPLVLGKWGEWGSNTMAGYQSHLSSPPPNCRLNTVHTIVHPWTLVPYTLSTRSTHHIHCGLHSAHTPKRLHPKDSTHPCPHTHALMPHIAHMHQSFLSSPTLQLHRKLQELCTEGNCTTVLVKKMLHNAQCILIPILCIAKYNFLPSVECTMSDPLYKTNCWENLLKSTECWIVHADRAFRPEKAPLYPPWLNQHNVLHSGSWNSS